jgi:hypothetical protein
VGMVPTPTLCSSPSTFLWGRHWLIRLNPYVIQQETRVEVALQGGAERFLATLRPEAPFFVLTENSPTLWPIRRPRSASTRGFCLFSNQGPLLSLDRPQWVAPLEGGREAPARVA